MRRSVRVAAVGSLGAALATATAVGARVGGRTMVGRTEARLCACYRRPPFTASDRAHALHERLWVADLHADSLLWGRDLLRARHTGPRRRPATHRGQRRTTGLRRLDQVAAPPEHRPQRRPERRRDPAGAGARLAAGDMATVAAAGAAHGEPRGCDGGPIGRPTHDHPLGGRSCRLRDGPRRTTCHHRRPPRHRRGPRARWRPGQRRGRRRRRLPDDVAEPFLRQRVQWVGAWPREGRADRGRPRDAATDGGARHAPRRGPCVGGDDRRCPRDGRSTGGRLAHWRSRRRRQRPQSE